MKLHEEILDEPRRRVWQRLRGLRNVGYLAGGTSLALQLGHRVSYDFDIFCEEKITPRFATRLRRTLPLRTLLIRNADEFTYLTDGDVKITFFRYPWPLRDYCLDEPMPLPLLSVLGVAISKAYTLNLRNQWRDYLDLYVIMKRREVSLARIVREATRVYGAAFSEKLFLAQLLYTADISPTEVATTPLLHDAVTLAVVKKFFIREVDHRIKNLRGSN